MDVGVLCEATSKNSCPRAEKMPKLGTILRKTEFSDTFDFKCFDEFEDNLLFLHTS